MVSAPTGWPRQAVRPGFWWSCKLQCVVINLALGTESRVTQDQARSLHGIVMVLPIICVLRLLIPLLERGCCKTLKGRGRNHKKHKKHKNSCAFLCILCFLWFLPRFSFGFCNTLFQGESVARIRPVLPEALRLPHFLVSICRKHSGSRTCWPALRSSHIQFVCKARRTRSDAGQAGGRRLPPVFWSARSATDFLEAFSSLSHIENRDPFSEPGNRNNTRIHPRDILTWN